MPFFHFSRHSGTVLILLVLLALSGLLMGCGGSGGDSASPASIYAGKSVSATKMTLGSRVADLQVATAASGNVATGTLTLTDPSRATRLVIATPNCVGTYDPKTGALSLTGAYELPAGTRHTFSVVGTLPVAPSNKGSITITLDGQAYGPFVFGDNTPAPSGGNPGGGTPSANSLVISGLTANTTIAMNGAFTGTAQADKFGAQYSFAIIKDVSASPITEFSGDIFVASAAVGQTIDLAKAEQGNVAYQESGRLFYVAVSGTETFDAVSSTSITVTFHNARFQAQTPLTGSTGEFILNGSFTAPVTNH